LPLPKDEKKLIVQELKEELGEATGIILTDYQGLSVKEMSQLRDALRKNNIKFKVYKNTLIKRASKEIGLEELTNNLLGCTAIAFSKGDPLLSIKLLHQFSQENEEKFKLKMALLEGQVFLQDQLAIIASLPPKEKLLATLFSNIKSPINSFVFVLKSPLLELVNVLEQIKKRNTNN